MSSLSEIKKSLPNFLKEFRPFIGLKLDKLPKEFNVKYVLLSDGSLYKRDHSINVNCGHCDEKHNIYKWEPVIVKSSFAFLDISLQKIFLFDWNTYFLEAREKYGPETKVTAKKLQFIPVDISENKEEKDTSNDFNMTMFVNQNPTSTEVILPESKLEAHKRGDFYNLTGVLMYTIIVKNVSQVTAKNIRIIDPLPNIDPHKWYITVPKDTENCEIKDNVFKAEFSELNPGESILFKIAGDAKSLFQECDNEKQQELKPIKITAENAPTIELTLCNIIQS